MSCIRGDESTVNPRLKQLYGDNGTVVTSIEGLLTDAETQYLLDRADGLFQRSTVMKDGGDKLDDVRTSSTAFLPKGDDEVLSCIEKRISTYALHPVTHLEPLQVTDYTNRQHYAYHHDYFDSAKDGKPDRTTTVFSYLKSENLEHGQCGGATAFGKLKDADGNELRVYPKRGDAVMWSNRTLSGGVNANTLHSGEMLTCDTSRKTGLNAWFRDHPWDANGKD